MMRILRDGKAWTVKSVQFDTNSALFLQQSACVLFVPFFGPPWTTRAADGGTIIGTVN